MPNREFYHPRFWFCGCGSAGAELCPRPFARKGQVSGGQAGTEPRFLHKICGEDTSGNGTDAAGLPKAEMDGFPEFCVEMYEKSAAKAAPFGFLPIEIPARCW